MKLEERVEKSERRPKTVEDAIILLTALTDSHNDRLEKFLFSLEELRNGKRDTDEKINMLIDAQIRTEEKMQVTEEKLQRLEAKVSDLTDSVKTAHERIDKIEE